MKIKINIIIFAFGLLLLNSCGDPPPVDYIPVYFLEGYLFVDSPINNIKIAKSQNLQDSVKYSKYLKQGMDDVESAKIFAMDFKDNSKVAKQIDLVKNDTSFVFFNPDQKYFVDSMTTYKIEVKMKDGTFLKSSTTTPKRIFWDKDVKPALQYPKDTIASLPTDTISWTKADGVDWFIIIVKAMDTTGYGKYGIDSGADKEDKNRRIERSFKGNRDFTELTTWSIVPSNQTPVVWSAFNWFGEHQCAVYAPDYNMTKWFIQSRTAREFNPLLSTVEGGAGCFGSASMIRDTTFLIKNQK